MTPHSHAMRSPDPFEIAGKIFDLLRAQTSGGLKQWNMQIGPPLHPAHFHLHPESALVRGTALGGFQFHVEGISYQGRVVVYLMDNGTYTVQTRLEMLEQIPEKLLGDVLAFLILRKKRKATAA